MSLNKKNISVSCSPMFNAQNPNQTLGYVCNRSKNIEGFQADSLMMGPSSQMQGMMAPSSQMQGMMTPSSQMQGMMTPSSQIQGMMTPSSQMQGMGSNLLMQGMMGPGSLQSPSLSPATSFVLAPAPASYEEPTLTPVQKAAISAISEAKTKSDTLQAITNALNALTQ
jgi:hypothetical protein